MLSDLIKISDYVRPSWFP